MILQTPQFEKIDLHANCRELSNTCFNGFLDCSEDLCPIQIKPTCCPHCTGYRKNSAISPTMPLPTWQKPTTWHRPKWLASSASITIFVVRRPAVSAFGYVAQSRARLWERM